MLAWYFEYDFYKIKPLTYEESNTDFCVHFTFVGL